jgi:hypothetical protein
MSSPTLQALDALNAQLVEASAWMQALEAHETPNPLAFPVARMLERVDAAAQALETLLRREEVRT